MGGSGPEESAEAGRQFGKIIRRYLEAGPEAAIAATAEVLAEGEGAEPSSSILETIRSGWQKALDPDYRPPSSGDYSDFIALQHRIRAADRAGDKREALQLAFILFSHTRPGSITHRSATALLAKCAAEAGEEALCEALAHLYLAQDHLLQLTRGRESLEDIVNPPAKDSVRGLMVIDPIMVHAAATLILHGKGDVFRVVLEQAVAYNREMVPSSWITAVEKLRSYYRSRRNWKSVARLSRLLAEHEKASDAS
jgi:hypothetical protein